MCIGSLVKDGEVTEAPYGDLTDGSWNFAEGAKEWHLTREGAAVLNTAPPNILWDGMSVGWPFIRTLKFGILASGAYSADHIFSIGATPKAECQITRNLEVMADRQEDK